MAMFPPRISAKLNRIPAIHSLRIRTKLLLTLLPSTIIILVATGIATNWFSGQFLNEAIQRNVRLRTLALAHEVEIFLNECREDILELRQGPVTRQALNQFWHVHHSIHGWGYACVAYLTSDADKCVYLVWQGDKLTAIPPADIPLVRPDPRSRFDVSQTGQEGIAISPVVEATYPITSQEHLNTATVNRIIRFTTFIRGRNGNPDGLLVLAVSVYQLRDILTQFNSPHSPVYAFIRSQELRYSFLFGMDGWIWFQSEETTGRAQKLSSQLARAGFSGTFGKPGLPSAFRPFEEHSDYWRMVNDTRQGTAGLITMPNPDPSSDADSYYMGYAPVKFRTSTDKDPAVYAGVVFVDRSRLGMWAGYRQVDVIFVIALVSTIFLSLLVYVLSRLITRPIFDLAAAVDRAQKTGDLKEIDLPTRDYETSHLIGSINGLFATISQQVEELKMKDVQLIEAAQSESVRLEEEIRALKKNFLIQDIQEILGVSPIIESLKIDILKAASVDADVLILGDTGTGKQLAAEAIHRLSNRSTRPFISINCGALDENLLMDELFGHKKGAFTEARTERRGAFLAANGGILFLDEIGTASPKVQQSLLRALSMRKITPLGSDREYDVDVRVIAATNENLLELVEAGRFREDLYYRLKVINITTPPLIDHCEDIPVLANHFLKAAASRMGKKDISMTRGALHKLRTYDWPGNIRELQNCITGAVAMAESSLIHARDIKLDACPISFPTRSERPTAAVWLNPIDEEQHRAPDGVALNERQKKAVSIISNGEEISRSDYQKLVDPDLPRRTAVYDLQDMVKKGVLEMRGRGPATRYRLVRDTGPNDSAK